MISSAGIRPWCNSPEIDMLSCTRQAKVVLADETCSFESGRGQHPYG